MDNESEKLHALIEKLGTAMMVAAEGSRKIAEIERDPHLNLSYFDKGEWVSVSGIARLSRDRAKIRELYATDWRAWFPEEGDPRHGTPEDPRIVLIGVDIHAASFFDIDSPRPVVMYEVAKGWLTGTMPDVGEVHHVGPRSSGS